MILFSLKTLAESEGLTRDPHYEPKLVRWVISIGSDGNLIGVLSTVSPRPGEAKPLATTMRIPRRLNRQSENVPNFLVDTAEYVLGLLPTSVCPKSRHKRAEARRLLFLSKIEEAARQLSNSALNSASKFLKSDSCRLRTVSLLQQQGCASFELVCFKVGERLIHDMPDIQAYFSGVDGAVRSESSVCVICGDLRPVEHSHPKIQLRGGDPVGNALVSFNAPAFESFGWRRDENAPTCVNCARSYVTALRRLVSTRCLDPYDARKFLPPHYIGLTQDTTAVFWANDHSEPLASFSDIFEKPNSEAASLSLKTPWTSAESAIPAEFHCLLISGGRGRAVLRGSLNLPLTVVETNVKEFYSVTVQLCEQSIPLFRLLHSLAGNNKENFPPCIACDLFSAILCGSDFPRSLLVSTIKRCRVECQVSKERALLLHFYLVRNKHREDLMMGLNRALPDTAYRLGRLLAVLERQQCATRRQLKRTVADRYYASASTRPKSVFPTLMRLCRCQVSTVQAGGFFQREIAEILDAIQSFPAHLSVDEQGLFALGFYHQRKAYYKGSSEGSEDKTGDGSASSNTD